MDAIAGRDPEPSWWRVLAPLVLLGLAALPYLQVGGFGYVNYDDPLHIGRQAPVLAGLGLEQVSWAFTATPSNLWHPLTWISYMVDVSWFGGGVDRAGPAHLSNLGYSLVGVLGLYLLLRVVGVGALVGVVAVSLFAFHPTHVEAVAWVSGRKEVLYSAFALLSVWCYARKGRAGGEGGARWSGFGAWVFFVAALLSKPTAVVIPLLFVMVDGLQGRGAGWSGRTAGSLWRASVRKWPYLLASLAAGVVAVVVQYSGSLRSAAESETLWERLPLVLARLGNYLWKVVLPHPLSVDYPVPGGWELIAYSLIGLMSLAILAVLWVGRRGLGPLGFGLGWLVICLAPALGFFYVGGSFIADRYAYLTLAGPVMGLALWLQGQPGRVRVCGLIAAGCLSLVWARQSAGQVAIWGSDLALFRHAVEVTPGSATAQTNLASAYRLEGDEGRARQHYELALEAEPFHVVANYNLARIHHGAGEVGQAIAAARRSLRGDAGYARSHHLLGLLLGDQASGDYRDGAGALRHLDAAYRADPQEVRYGYDLAVQLLRSGRAEEARELIDRLLARPGLGGEWQGRLRELGRQARGS